MAPRSHTVRSSQRGVTLLELMIAVTLVAGLSTGMLMAMRTSLLTYQKTAKKLETNRRFVKAQQILSSQISAVMPSQGLCSNGTPSGVVTPSFLAGSVDGLRLISSYSIAEGARGYPRIVEYRVVAGERGSVRLVATERAYSGPQSTTPFCEGGTSALAPAISKYELGAPTAGPADASSFVLADNLAYCRFSYHEVYDQNTFLEKPWLPLWSNPVLPGGVRIDMRPLVPETGGLAVLSLTIPIQVNRDPQFIYDDRN